MIVILDRCHFVNQTTVSKKQTQTFCLKKLQENLANTKVSARQQYMYDASTNLP